MGALTEIGEERNVELSVIAHLQGDAQLADLHVYQSWDDAAEALSSDRWLAPAICYELLGRGRAISHDQGQTAILAPYSAVISFFGRVAGAGARAERDAYMGEIRKRLECEDKGDGRTIKVMDFSDASQPTIGYAEVTDISARAVPSEGLSEKERYRAEITFSMTLFKPKASWAVL